MAHLARSLYKKRGAGAPLQAVTKPVFPAPGSFPGARSARLSFEVSLKGNHSKLCGSTVILIGFSFQISSTYSWIVRSEENFPEDAMLMMALFAQAAWSW